MTSHKSIKVCPDFFHGLMIYFPNSTSVSRQLYPDVKASHLGPVSILHSGVGVVGPSSQEVDQDAGDLWEGEGEGVGAAVEARVEGEHTVLAIGEVGGAEEVAGAGKELVTIVVTGPDADVPDGEAGDGDGDQALPLDLQGHAGPSWDGLVQGDLHVEGDGLPGGDDQGEGLYRDVVQGEHVRVCSITKSNLQLVQLEVPGGDHGGAGEESGEDLHDAGAVRP